MQHVKVGKGDFKVLLESQSAQAAVMTLAPGESTGPPQNEHPRAEQWLFVIAGSGRAVVNEHRVRLRPGSLLLIERGEVHQVSSTGRTPLVTLNLYAPPAYTAGGNVKKQVQ